MIRQDGALLAYNRGPAVPTTRRGYKGNSNADVFVADLRSGGIRQLTDTNPREFRTHVHDGNPMWGADGMIYYLSERDGNFNLWRMNATGGDQRQVTDHDDDIQSPSISPDGKRIVYELDFELWTLDVPAGRPRKIAVAIAADLKDNTIEYLSTENRADGFAPSPSGDYVAVDFHGEIFAVPSEADIGEKQQLTGSPWRERMQQYSPDGTQHRLHQRRDRSTRSSGCATSPPARVASSRRTRR